MLIQLSATYFGLIDPNSLYKFKYHIFANQVFKPLYLVLVMSLTAHTKQSAQVPFAHFVMDLFYFFDGLVSNFFTKSRS